MQDQSVVQASDELSRTIGQSFLGSLALGQEQRPRTGQAANGEDVHHAIGAKSISTRIDERNASEIGSGHFMLACAELSDWIYGNDPDPGTSAKRIRPDTAALPDGLELVADGLAGDTDGGGGLVQWAMVNKRDSDTSFIVFRGTIMTNLLDWTVNLGVVQRVMPSAHGLIVHGGMLTSLEDPRSPTLHTLEKLLREKRPSNIILCGHSLGGGYAVIAAAHLLAQQQPVTKVFSFGSPQVVSDEQQSNVAWQQLNQITTTLINKNDLVPRTLGVVAKAWVFEFLPHVLLQKSIPESVNNTITFVAKQAGYTINVKESVVAFFNNIQERSEYFYAFAPLGRVILADATGFVSLNEANGDVQRVGKMAIAVSSEASVGLLSAMHSSSADETLHSVLDDHTTPGYIAAAHHVEEQLRHHEYLRNSPSVNFAGQSLCGTILPVFTTLDMLTVLNLSDNKLNGPIPEFTSCPNLEVLDLQRNYLWGQVPAFTCCRKLRVFNASGQTVAFERQMKVDCRNLSGELVATRYHAPGSLEHTDTVKVAVQFKNVFSHDPLHIDDDVAQSFPESCTLHVCDYTEFWYSTRPVDTLPDEWRKHQESNPHHIFKFDEECTCVPKPGNETDDSESDDDTAGKVLYTAGKSVLAAGVWAAGARLAPAVGAFGLFCSGIAEHPALSGAVGAVTAVGALGNTRSPPNVPSEGNQRSDRLTNGESTQTVANKSTKTVVMFRFGGFDTLQTTVERVRMATEAVDKTFVEYEVQVQYRGQRIVFFSRYSHFKRMSKRLAKCGNCTWEARITAATESAPLQFPVKTIAALVDTTARCKMLNAFLQDAVLRMSRMSMQYQQIVCEFLQLPTIALQEGQTAALQEGQTAARVRELHSRLDDVEQSLESDFERLEVVSSGLSCQTSRRGGHL
jgi:hypothetical protein